MPKFDPEAFTGDLSAYEKAGKMAEILDSMDPEDAKVVESALRDLNVPAARLAKALTNQGFPAGSQPIRTWRAKHVTS